MNYFNKAMELIYKRIVIFFCEKIEESDKRIQQMNTFNGF